MKQLIIVMFSLLFLISFFGCGEKPVAMPPDYSEKAGNMEKHMISDWTPSKDLVALMNKAKKGDVNEINKFASESKLRAISQDYTQLVMVREHNAWEVEGEGWRSANLPVEKGGQGRQMIILVDLTSVDDMLEYESQSMAVPFSFPIHQVEFQGQNIRILSTKDAINCTPTELMSTMWSALTGHAQPESMIESKFFVLRKRDAKGQVAK